MLDEARLQVARDYLLENWVPDPAASCFQTTFSREDDQLLRKHLPHYMEAKNEDAWAPWFDQTTLDLLAKLGIQVKKWREAGVTQLDYLELRNYQ